VRVELMRAEVAEAQEVWRLVEVEVVRLVLKTGVVVEARVVHLQGQAVLGLVILEVGEPFRMVCVKSEVGWVVSCQLAAAVWASGLCSTQPKMVLSL
jgi:hypothetical protein